MCTSYPVSYTHLDVYKRQHHNGITKAMEALGMDPDTQLIIQDEITEDYENVATAVDTLVGEDCDIIFGISFGYLNAMADKAEEYPDVIFSHATGYMSNPNNYNNYFGRIYQARYLAGIAAGLKSLETNNNNVGYVSAYGTCLLYTSSRWRFSIRPSSMTFRSSASIMTAGTSASPAALAARHRRSPAII